MRETGSAEGEEGHMHGACRAGGCSAWDGRCQGTCRVIAWMPNEVNTGFGRADRYRLRTAARIIGHRRAHVPQETNMDTMTVATQTGC
ncbi:hypothetical protein XPU_1327 [Xanthomonas arboricola pv. pruni str. MAFF 311562]|nr:hypothetical protein XPU_1327 [Xanthomonas arboricola pv. pruni str. MAFF 311562]